MPFSQVTAGQGPYPQPPAQAAHQSAQLRQFWLQQADEISQVGTDMAEFKNHQLPLARIKKVGVGQCSDVLCVAHWLWISQLWTQVYQLRSTRAVLVQQSHPLGWLRGWQPVLVGHACAGCHLVCTNRKAPAVLHVLCQTVSQGFQQAAEACMSTRQQRQA